MTRDDTGSGRFLQGESENGSGHRLALGADGDGGLDLDRHLRPAARAGGGSHRLTDILSLREDEMESPAARHFKERPADAKAKHPYLNLLPLPPLPPLARAIFFNWPGGTLVKPGGRRFPLTTTQGPS